MLKITAIETNKGFYISQQSENNWSNNNLQDKLFDGVAPEKTFYKEWSLIAKKPTKVSHMVRQPDINHRCL
jgi:hypothetical protein